MALSSSLLAALPTAQALASHGPTRSGSDPCNGTAAFDINNVITRDLVDAIASQNPGARNPDGTLDRTKITHALLYSSGHVALMAREKAGFPLSRVIFEFAPADSGWNGDSTKNPGYLTAIDATEDPARDADSDLVVGKTFLFDIPTDVVGDGNYVARIRAFQADGSEAGRLCVDAVVSNGQSQLDANKANSDPQYEPTENASAGFGFTPQPVVWFPAGEPSVAQQAGYGANVARIEFLEGLQSVLVERQENLPAPTGLAGTPSTTGGSLATGTYFYKVTALNATGETIASSEIGVPVSGPTGRVALTWNAVSGASGYRIYRGTSSGGENVYYTSSTNSYTDTNATSTGGSPPLVGTAKIWVDYSGLLSPDDFARPHFIAGGRMDGTGLEPFSNKKVWGPGYRFPFGSLPAGNPPSEKIRVTARDAVGKSFCGVYTFSAGANSSFLASAPGGC